MFKTLISYFTEMTAKTKPQIAYNFCCITPKSFPY